MHKSANSGELRFLRYSQRIDEYPQAPIDPYQSKGVALAMLREIRDVQQVAGEARRRWFFCHELDLVVWFDAGDVPIAFQLAYDKYADEHSISWHRDRGYRHYLVDDGESSGLSSQTPFLFAAGQFERDRVLAKFAELAGGLPPELTAFVTDKLQAFDGLACA